VNVSQVSRQGGQAALYILTGPIPLDQGFHGKPVTKIVKTRSMTIRRTTQSDLPRQGVKRAPDLSAVQPRPASGYEKRLPVVDPESDPAEMHSWRVPYASKDGWVRDGIYQTWFPEW
jgi:hypothetical protein